MRALLHSLLVDVQQGRLAPDEALSRLPQAALQGLVQGFVDVEGARVDTQRALRQGVAEVVYGLHKTPADVARIGLALLAAGQNVLVTRATPAQADALLAVAADAVYDERAGILRVRRGAVAPVGVNVAVVCAGTTDLPVLEECAQCLEHWGVAVDRLVDVGVAGLHRLLPEIPRLQRADVVVAIAGMEGALPSVLGGLLDKPLIAVPTSTGYGTSLGGLTALLAMMTSCSSGVTVVNVDNGFGAAAAAWRLVQVLRARAVVG